MLTDRERQAMETLLDTDTLHGLRAFLAHARADALEARVQGMLQRGVIPLPGAF